MKTMISFQCDTLEEAQAVLTACAAIGKEPHACSKQYMDSKQLLKNTLELLDVKPAAEDIPQRKNISPGEPSITRLVMTGGPVVEIFDHLKRGEQPPEKYAEQMKLLWKRGEVRFDGEKFYV